MLSTVGIRAKLIWLERGRYNAQRGYQDALLISSASAPEPWHRFVSYPCDQEPGINRSRVCDREVTDKLLKEFNLATDEKRIKEIIRELMIRWVDQAYFYSLPTPYFYILGQPRLRNFDTGGQPVCGEPDSERTSAGASWEASRKEGKVQAGVLWLAERPPMPVRPTLTELKVSPAMYYR